MQKIEILVVDDDYAIRQMLIEALTMDRQYLVEEASNGIEASIKLGTYRPDLLILDIFMPEMEGLEFIRKVVKKKPHLPIIAVSGGGNESYLQVALSFGASYIMQKPLQPDELLSTVRLVLQR